VKSLNDLWIIPIITGVIGTWLCTKYPDYMLHIIAVGLAVVILNYVVKKLRKRSSNTTDATDEDVQPESRDAATRSAATRSAATHDTASSGGDGKTRAKPANAFRKMLASFGTWLSAVRRRKAILLAAAAVAVVAAAGVIVYFSSVKTSYYCDIVEKYGLPYGVGDRLSGEERSKRVDYWEVKNNNITKTMTATFITNSGPIGLLDANATLYSMDYFSQPTCITYSYEKAKGSAVVQRAEYQRSGKTLLLLSYSRDDEGNLSDNVTITSCTGSESSMLYKSSIFRVPSSGYRAILPQAVISVYYNDDGLPLRRMLNAQSAAYGTGYDIYGESFEYTKTGNIQKITYLDKNGIPKPGNNGVTAVRFYYTDNDQIENIKYFADAECTVSVRGNNGAEVDVYGYDTERRNLVSRTFKNSEGLDRPDRHGVYAYNYAYSGGALRKESYHGAGGVALYIPAYKCDSREYEYISGALRGSRFFKVTAESKKASAEAAELISALQISAEPAEPSFDAMYAFARSGAGGTPDAAASPDTLSSGEAAPNSIRVTTVYELDGKSRVICESYKDSEGNPVSFERGYASKKFAYDTGTGNLSSEEYFDANGALYISNGYSGVGYSYTDGELSKVTYRIGRAPAINFNLWYANREITYQKDSILELNGIQYHAVHEKYTGCSGESLFCKNGYSEIALYYDRSGQLGCEVYFDTYGEPVLNNRGYAAVRYTRESGRITKTEYLDCLNKAAINLDSGCSVREVRYNGDNGLAERVSYFDTDGITPVPDKVTGATGYLNEFDSGNNICKVTYFGQDGKKPAIRKDEGYAVLQRVYNPKNNLEWELYFDADGRTPVLNSSTWAASRKWEYKDGGSRVTDEYYYGLRGELEPVLDKKYGAAHIAYRYDNFGNCTEVSYYGLKDGALTLTKNEGFAVKEQYYDDWGRYLGAKYLDVNHQPIINKLLGYASMQQELDARGNILLERYYGIHDEPILIPNDNVAGMKYTYAESGRYAGMCETVRYLGIGGPDDIILNGVSWAAGINWESDDFGRDLRGTFVGKNNEPISIKTYGYSTWEYHYDPRGNQDSTCFYDADGRLTLLSGQGYAVSKRTYLPNGRLVSESYYGVSMSDPVYNTVSWCSVIKYGYDRFGRTAEVSYWGTDSSKPALNKNSGCAKYTVEFDWQGKVISSKYYNEKNELAPLKSGSYAIERVEYDGSAVITSYYISESELCVNTRLKGNHATRITEYDARGLDAKTTYLDVNGNPTPVDDHGASQIMTAYNEWGILQSEIYLDVNEEGDFVPVLRNDRRWAMHRVAFDRYGRNEREEYLGADLITPVTDMQIGASKITRKLNMYGNAEEVRYFGAGSEPVTRKGSGYSVCVNTYDSKQRLCSEEYFDTHNERVVSNYGYASYTRTFDESNGKVDEVIYRGRNNLPMIVRRYGWGYAIIRQHYNDRGLLESREYFDDAETPKLILNANQYAREVLEYDSLGNQSKATYFDAFGEKAVNAYSAGYASTESVYVSANLITRKNFDIHGSEVPQSRQYYYSVRNEYDDLGRLWKTTFLDKYDNPVKSDTGYSICEYQYDHRGYKLYTRYYDSEKQPKEYYGNGYTTYKTEYDENGRLVLESYLDNRDKDVVWADGYAHVRTGYFPNGLKQWAEYLDKDMNLVAPDSKGFARIEYQYDSYGRTVLEEHFDANHEPAILKEGYSKKRVLYGTDGSWISVVFLDTSGNPVNIKLRDESMQLSIDGYAGIEVEYDGRGNESRVKYLSKENKTFALVHSYQELPFGTLQLFAGNAYALWNDNDRLISTAYSIVETEYDELDRAVKRTYYADDDKLISADYKAIRMSYSAQSNDLSRLWFVGADDKPVNNKELGYAEKRINTVKDTEPGEVIKYNQTSLYFDEDGQRCIISDGYYYERTRMDEYGRVSDISYWGLPNDAGKLKSAMNTSSGFAQRLYTYDEFGNVIKEEFLDDYGNLTINPQNGAAIIERKWDTWGHVIMEAHRGTGGEFVLIKGSNYTKLEYIYDENGNWLETKCYDIDGRLM